MLSIASLYYQLKKYDESKEWCNKVLKIDPQNAEAYYRIAVIDFDDVLEKTGIQGENVEFMTPEEKAKALKRTSTKGLTSLNKALEIRPTYFDAMEYQNLLWREKAKFEKDEAQRQSLFDRPIWCRRRLLLFVEGSGRRSQSAEETGSYGRKVIASDVDIGIAIVQS